MVARPSRAEQGKGAGPVLCRVREGGRRREEGEGRRKERKGGKEKKREGKREKEKEKEGKEKEKKREGGIRAGITALIAGPVGHAWRPGARERDAQVEGKQGWDSGRFGCRFGSSGYREVRREMNQDRDRAQRQNKD